MINFVLHEEVIFILYFYCFSEKNNNGESEPLINCSQILRNLCLRKKGAPLDTNTVGQILILFLYLFK